MFDRLLRVIWLLDLAICELHEKHQHLLQLFRHNGLDIQHVFKFYLVGFQFVKLADFLLVRLHLDHFFEVIYLFYATGPRCLFLSQRQLPFLFDMFENFQVDLLLQGELDVFELSPVLTLQRHKIDQFFINTVNRLLKILGLKFDFILKWDLISFFGKHFIKTSQDLALPNHFIFEVLIFFVEFFDGGVYMVSLLINFLLPRQVKQ